MRLPHRRAVLAAVAVISCALLAVPGAAEAIPGPQPDPVWSGLDATGYAGPIGEPGTLLDQRPLDKSLVLPAAGSAYRVLYASRDIHGGPAASTGAIYLPRTPAPRGGFPVIAWAHGTVGLGDRCTPSAQIRSENTTQYLDHWLKQGYAIVATDYVGLGTPGLMSYLNGTVAANSVVDSVISAQQTGLPLAERWAIVGQSQGAAAALNAARRATELSRGTGLDYRGVVATGTPANLEQILTLAGPGFPPTALPNSLNAYLAYILAGFDDARPDLKVSTVLTPSGRTVLKQARTLCYGEMRQKLNGASPSDWFERPVDSIRGVQAALTDYMSTPYSGYDRPIFLGQGLLDTDVPAPSALSLYAQMEAAGQPVELHVYPDQDHSGTVLASLPDSTPFVKRILR